MSRYNIRLISNIVNKKPNYLSNFIYVPNYMNLLDILIYLENPPQIFEKTWKEIE